MVRTGRLNEVVQEIERTILEVHLYIRCKLTVKLVAISSRSQHWVAADCPHGMRDEGSRLRIFLPFRRSKEVGTQLNWKDMKQDEQDARHMLDGTAAPEAKS